MSCPTEKIVLSLNIALGNNTNPNLNQYYTTCCVDGTQSVDNCSAAKQKVCTAEYINGSTSGDSDSYQLCCEGPELSTPITKSCETAKAAWSSAHICVRKQPDVDHCRVNFSNESACNGERACAWNGVSGTCNIDENSEPKLKLGSYGVPKGMPSCSDDPADCIQYDPTSTAQDWQCLPQANLMGDNFEICCADNKYIYTGNCDTNDVASQDSWTCPYGTRKTRRVPAVAYAPL